MDSRILNYKLLILVLFVFCSIAVSCKRKEAQSPFKSQLPDATSTLTITSTDEITGNISSDEYDDEFEVMSIEIDANDYIAPMPKQVQIALKNAGYYKGNIDGKIGPKSKKAIVDFQKGNGLETDGQVGPKTWTKLKVYLDSKKE